MGLIRRPRNHTTALPRLKLRRNGGAGAQLKLRNRGLRPPWFVPGGSPDDEAFDPRFQREAQDWPDHWSGASDAEKQALEESLKRKGDQEDHGPRPAETKEANRKPKFRLKVNGKAHVAIAALRELQHEQISIAATLVEGLLPAAGAGMLVGAPFVGKTRFALQLALAVAAGHKTFLDRRLLRGPVLYLALELTKLELQDKVREIAGTEDWPAAFHYAARGMFPDAVHGGLRELKKWCGEHKPALVVIDTWAAWRRPPTGQSLYDEDYRAIDELRALGGEVGCFILVNHHAGKKARGGDPTKDVIGTSGLGAGASVMLGLTSQGKPGAIRGVLSMKGNAIPGQRIPLAVDEKPLRWHVGDAKMGRPNKAKQAALDFLRAELNDGPKRAQDLKRGAVKKGVCKLWTLQHAKKELGIESIGTGSNTRWKLPKERV